MPGPSSQGIFLSYRREDTGPYARSLQLQLSQRLPDARIFMDLDSIEPGLDFAEVIEGAVNSCAVLVALIGRQWVTLTDDDGGRRLDNPDDLVRFEVKTALNRGVRVIPVLIDGAGPLRQQQLPADLHKLARLNAHKLSYDRYQDDTDRLLDLIQRILAAARELAEADHKAQEEAERPAQPDRKDVRAGPPLPPPPPWRRTSGSSRALIYLTSPEADQQVNAAIHLRRPLLVTGPPGAGKSSLAYAVADRYGLGSVLRWRIHRHSTLREGLYHYDAVGRSEAASLRGTDDRVGNATSEASDIGAFIRLGPLGTALLPGDKPRILLIEDLDRSDEDLPDDVLDVLEVGEFEIPELARLPVPEIAVSTDGSGERSVVIGGHVRCSEIPVVIITSGGQRDFSMAFKQRCVLLEIPLPDEETIARIVAAHLGPEALEDALPLIQEFVQRREHGVLAVGQLLDAIFLIQSGAVPVGEARAQLTAALLPYLEDSQYSD